MDDKKKIQAAAIILVVVPMFLTIMMVSMSFHSKGAEDVRVFEEQLEENAKTELKSYVEMAYTLVDSNYRNSGSEEYLEKYYGLALTNIVDAAQSQLEHYADLVEKEKLKPEEAKQQAAAVISRMVFDGGEGVIWISDITPPAPRMIVSHEDPVMNDLLLADLGLKEGGGLFKTLDDVAMEKSGEFKPLPGKATEEGGAKSGAGISYVRLFSEWNWVIGASMYLDDALEMAIEKSLSDLRDIRYDNGAGYFWITDMGEPIPRIVLLPVQPDQEGRVATLEKFNRALESDMNIFEVARTTADTNSVGFFEFYWDKPIDNGIVKDVRKTAYVKLFEPFGWVIGADIYMDDIEREVKKKESIVARQVNGLIVKIVIMACVLSVFAIIIANFIINKYIEPAFIRAREHIEPEDIVEWPSDNVDLEEEPEKKPVEPAEPQPAPAPQAASAPPEGWEKLIADTVVQISKTVLEEQTKLMAYNAKMEDEEAGRRHDVYEKISGELASLSEDIHRNSEAIEELIENSKKSNRPRRRL